jgi:NAD dependent epimerase/dehydratase family enzyme
MKEKSQDGISASAIRYYGSLTDEEIAEDRAWGDFAARQWVDDTEQ